jgi:NTP pyrophosphatase (non-canonical NTP hydrolase)
MNQVDILNAIIKERKRQDWLHPHNRKADYLAIMIEEVGEVGKALQGDGSLKEELIQLAATCVRWLEAL